MGRVHIGCHAPSGKRAPFTMAPQQSPCVSRKGRSPSGKCPGPARAAAAADRSLVSPVVCRLRAASAGGAGVNGDGDGATRATSGGYRRGYVTIRIKIVEFNILFDFCTMIKR